MRYHDTREGWLQEAVEIFRKEFKTVGLTIPAVRVSCSFPHAGAFGRDGKPRVIGQCWDPRATAGDSAHHIQITPALDTAGGPQGILATLVHELVHATVGCAAGHGPVFKQAAEAVLLTGRMTATVASDWGMIWLDSIARHLGPFPHVRIAPSPGTVGEAPGDPAPRGPIDGPRRRKGSPLKKCECTGCGYLARVTLKWLESAGAPVCPTCQTAMEW